MMPQRVEFVVDQAKRVKMPWASERARFCDFALDGVLRFIERFTEEGDVVAGALDAVEGSGRRISHRFTCLVLAQKVCLLVSRLAGLPRSACRRRQATSVFARSLMIRGSTYKDCSRNYNCVAGIPVLPGTANRSSRMRRPGRGSRRRTPLRATRVPCDCGRTRCRAR